MFRNSYQFFGETVTCLSRQVTVNFTNETKLTDYLKKISRKNFWKYTKVDTIDQAGFPDILLLRQDEYWQIEAKILRRKKLVSLKDNLKWQFGQIGYMTNALTRNLNYLLIVAKNSHVAFIKGASNDKTMRKDYPKFIKRL